MNVSNFTIQLYNLSNFTIQPGKITRIRPRIRKLSSNERELEILSQFSHVVVHVVVCTRICLNVSNFTIQRIIVCYGVNYTTVSNFTIQPDNSGTIKLEVELF